MLELFFRKKIVGIDLGAFGIKIIELSGFGKNITLENYADLKTSALGEVDPKTGSLPLPTIALAIKEMLAESRIKTKKVIFSVPDFMIFCTSFDLPPMPKKEIAGAIAFNATQYLTLPVSEVSLDWHIQPKNPNDKNTPWRVFLVAIPNQVIADYKTIAQLAGLELYAVEAEVLGIKRALIKNNQQTICLIDLGQKSSTISLINNGFLQESFSFDFSATSLMDGTSDAKEKLLAEIEDVLAEFLDKEKRPIQALYLTGGGANAIGLKEFLQEKLKKDVLLPDAFSGLHFTSSLTNKLKEMSGRFSAAVGVALSVFL